MKRFSILVLIMILAMILVPAVAVSAAECDHAEAVLVEAVPATHTTAGVAEYYYCSACDSKLDGNTAEATVLTDEELVIMATGHIRAEKVDAVPATHSVNGNIVYYYCADCDANFTDRSGDADMIPAGEEIISATGHIRAEKVEAVRATHTTAGSMEYYYCADCDANFTDRSGDADMIPAGEEIISATGHIRATKVEAVRATCTTAGSMEYYYCADCDANFTDRSPEADLIPEGEEIILAMGHIRAEHKLQTAPTHTSNGYYEHYYCSVCDGYYDGKAVDANQLTYEEVTILSMGHERAEYVEAIPATHTTAGVAGHYYCSVCDAKFDGTAYDAAQVTDEELVLLPMGHIRAEKVEAVRATHTTAGSMEYYYCADCDANFTDRTGDADMIPAGEEIIPAMGHIRAEKVEAVRATHTTAGSMEYYYCADCDANFTDRTGDADMIPAGEEVIPATGHIRATKFDAVRPTHTTLGSIEYWYCADCNANFTDRTGDADLIPAGEEIVLSMGHERAEYVEAIRATCTESGRAAYYYCIICDAKFDGTAYDAAQVTDEELVILPMGHIRANKIEAVMPTCTTDGHIEYYYCSACDGMYDGNTVEAIKLIDSDIVIPAFGHEYTVHVEAVRPTHTQNGNMEYYHCYICNGNYVGTEADAEFIPEGEEIVLSMGHERAEYVEAIPATHTTAGVAGYYYCTICDAKFDGTAYDAAQVTDEELVLVPMGHIRAEKIDAVRPTHTANGNIEYYHCYVCNANYVDITADAELIPAGEEIVLSMGHERAEYVEAIPATHTTAGVAEYYYCTICDAKFDGTAYDATQVTDEDLVLVPMGHIRAEKVEATVSTHTTNGNYEYYYCSVCDAKFDGRAADATQLTDEEVTILAMGHIRAEKVEAIPATHTMAGIAEYYYCSVCDAKFDGRAADATQLTDEEIVILPMGHIRAEKVEAIPATHTTAGIAEYYYCSVCDAKFDGRSGDAVQLTDEELVILPMGHIRAEKVEAISATHTTAGIAEYYYCADCDAKFDGRSGDAVQLTDEELVILPMGHIRAEKVEAIPATHTTAGVAEYYYCADCDAKFTDRSGEAVQLTDEELVILPMGHIRAEKVEAIPATHTTAGVAEYYYCADCDAKFDGRAADAAEVTDEDLVLLSMGHIRAEKVDAVPATHTTSGNYEYYYCSECDAKFDGRAPEAVQLTDEEVTILAMGHIRAEKVDAVVATHTTAGIAEYYYCSVCDAKFDGRAADAAEVTDEDLVLLPMGHIRAEKVDAVPATHTTAGVAEYYYCSVCDAKFDGRAADAAQLTDEEIVILPVGHIRAEKVEAIPATHTTAGVAEYYYCSVCDAKFDGRSGDAAQLTDEDLVILPMGHIRAEKTEAVAATHTTAGVAEYYYCSVCDAKYDSMAPDAAQLADEDLVILPMGHIRAEKVEAVPATHTTAGVAEYYYCSVCDAKFDGRAADAAQLSDAELVILPMGHIRAEKVEAVTATHTTAGVAEYYYCSVCDAKFDGTAPEATQLSDAELVILPTGHIRAEKVEAVLATHTTSGVAEYYYCADCDAKFDGRAADAAQVTDEDLVILPMGHIRADKVEAVPATHTTAGVAEYYYCSVCDAKFDSIAPDATELTDEDLVLAATGHDRAAKTDAKDATCTENGNIEYWYCAVCDAKFDGRAAEAKQLTDEDIVVEATGHAYDDDKDDTCNTCEEKREIASDDPTDDPTDEPTDKPTEKPTEQPTEKPADDNKPSDEKKGCGSFVGMGAFAMVFSIAAAGATAFKKKR